MCGFFSVLYVCNSLRSIYRSGIVELYSNSIFYLWRNCQLTFRMVAPFSIPTVMNEGANFSTSLPTLIIFSFYIIIWFVKRIYPSKNFFYIITPYLIIYTPLEMLCSSPAEHFSFVY